MRRTTILLAAAALAASTLTGCGAATTELTVLGPWIGAEEQSFRAVFAGFESAHHITIDYIGTPAVNEVLQADVQKGQPPDVAVLASPGELARYAASGQLRQIPKLDDAEYSKQWQSLLRLGTTNTYAVPVKADLKSIVWYDPDHVHGFTPATWSDLLNFTADSSTRTWCLGMEAYSTTGWPGGDWIEDILLHQSGPEVYAKWAQDRLPWTSDAVKAAWNAWGQLLAADGKQSAPAMRSAALLTYFGDAGKQMFDQHPGCLLEHQGSFATGSYPKGANYNYFPFPAFDPKIPKSSEVSVNPAGLFTDNPLAADFMTYLAGTQAQSVWPARQDSSAYSVNSQVRGTGVYRTAVSDNIAAALTSPTQILCLDASDGMPAEMSDAFSRAVLEYLGDPARLDTILADLEHVRAGLESTSNLTPCG